MLADRQVAAAFMAVGVKDLQLPEVDERVRVLNEALVAPVTAVVDDERAELLKALGVRDVR